MTVIITAFNSFVMCIDMLIVFIIELAMCLVHIPAKPTGFVYSKRSLLLLEKLHSRS